MNDYIFYIECFATGSTVGYWIYGRTTGDTFAEAFNKELAAVIAGQKINGYTYQIRAAELYNRNVLPAYTGTECKKRAEALIRMGLPFPGRFVPPADGGPVDISLEGTPLPKSKEPEVCLEVFFKGNRSHIDFSKITADLSKAPR
jgi:hypothetical protein